MKKTIVIFFVIIFSISIFAKEKSAFKASVSSLLIPAGGQFYNHSYWKAVTVIGLDSYYIAMYFYNDKKMEQYRVIADLSNFNQDQYEFYYEEKQNDLWWLGIITILSAADAFVDAKLYTFEAEKKKVRILFEQKSVGIQIKF